MRETEPAPKSRKGRIIKHDVSAKMETEQSLQRLQQSIIFEDSRFLILSKPSAMAVHGGSGIIHGGGGGGYSTKSGSP